MRFEPELIRRLQANLAVAQWSERRVAQAFYDRLFERAPSVKPLFGTDTATHAKKLTEALQHAVSNLDRFDELRVELQALGRRHVHYGAVTEHYPIVAAVLIECIGEASGTLWTDELRQDWEFVLVEVATAMLDGAGSA
jgi:hemoglobin-like flavoprotein